MKPCSEWQSLIAEMVFEEAETELGLAAHEHLAACVACREEERRLLSLRDDLRGTPVPPTAGFRTRLRAALPAAPPSRTAWLARPVPVWAALAACAFVAALALAMPREVRDRVAADPGVGLRARFVPAARIPPFASAGACEIRVRFAGPAKSTRAGLRSGEDRARDSL